MPQGLTKVDSTTRDAFRRMQAGTAINNEFYPVFSLDVFTDSVTGAMAFVAMVQEAKGELEQINQSYKQFLSSRIDESALRDEYYTINGIRICYYFHHTDQIVNHKLLGVGPAGKCFLVEYVMPAFAYSELDPAVTSAIAALRPLSNQDAPMETNE
jgi:hypothetical protein